MQLVLSLFLVTFPALLVAVMHRLLRKNPVWADRVMWGIVIAIWAISAVAWVSYGRQQDDVGLIVHGIMAWAASSAALLATITAAVIRWRS